MFVIGIYPRKSVYKDNSDSVSVQVQLCKEYASIVFKGKEIEFRVYDKDEGFSGKNTNRPSFRQLMEDVESDLLDAVMVYKLDRISRNVQEFSSMYETFQSHNVSFVSVKESFDTSTPMGRTVMYILAAFAQLERENISERVADNMLALGASGKWTGGKLPTGMTSVRRKIGDKEHSYLMVDPDTVWLVKLIYQLMLQGYPITRVERYCRDHAIRSHGGNFLSCSQIYNIVTNPVYCQATMEAYCYFRDLGCSLPDPSLFDDTKGLIGYGKTKNQSRQCHSSWTISIGIHDFVIPSSDWIYVQKHLKINKAFHAPKYQCGILKGVLRCKCGARMNVRTSVKNGKQSSHYYCKDMEQKGKSVCNTGYVKVNHVDNAFLDQLKSIRLNPSGLKLSEPDTVHWNIPAIKNEIRQLDQSIQNLTSALTQAMESSASAYIIQQINSLDTQKKKLENNLKKAELSLAAEKSRAETEAQIYQNILYLLDNFDSIEYSGKNELIRKTVKSCIFDGQNLHIVF